MDRYFKICFYSRLVKYASTILAALMGVTKILFNIINYKLHTYL